MTPELGELAKGLAELTKPLTIGFARVSAMLAVFPLLSSNSYPIALRNGIALAMLMPIYPLLRASAPDAPDEILPWLFYLLKEVTIGSAIGWAFAVLLWAMESVGDLLDIQTGTSSGAVFDPISQQPAALFSLLMRGICVAAFIDAGGLLALMQVFYESLRVWPAKSALPFSPQEAWTLARTSSASMLTMALSVALPLVVLLLVVELGLGLLNRSLPQLNAFSLSMPIKIIVAMLMLMLASGYVIDIVAHFVSTHTALSALGLR